MNNIFVGFLFVGLLCALGWTIIFGRRIIRTEKTDAVFGNPVRALGGWHWVIAGVASILLIWFYFSWDAARSFFPKAANELCQVAKVTSALNPMRSVFPMQSRLLRGTSLLDRDNTQLDMIDSRVSRASFSGDDAVEVESIATDLRDTLVSLTSPDLVDPAATAAFDVIAGRINAVTANLADPAFPTDVSQADIDAANAQTGWGVGPTEIPVLPETDRGRKFNAVSGELAAISKDFVAIRNITPAFKARISDLDSRIKALKTVYEEKAKSGGEGTDRTMLARQLDVVKQFGKVLKRVDDGSIFPPGVQDNVETALKQLDVEQKRQQGSLKIVDAWAMPGGTVLAGNTACSEQGSGRWLPKPSDTVRTFPAHC